MQIRSEEARAKRDVFLVSWINYGVLVGEWNLCW
uniref:Uncharacterized protein n=1 Tax=Arundo donax TaxID=35708 RepID=A0A0A9G830_ARUDO